MTKLSKRERIVDRLFEKLKALSKNKTEVFRNLDKPMKIPANGLVILRDSEAAKEVASFLSPPTHIYELTLQLELVIQDERASIRFQKVDMLISDIQAIIMKNRNLDELAEWVELRPAEFQDEPIEGAASIRTAIIPLTIRFYSSDN